MAEKRKLLDLLLSNCTLRDGAVSWQYRKPFDLIADAVEAEERLPRRERFKRAGNEIWLPGKDALRDRGARANPLSDSLLRNIATRTPSPRARLLGFSPPAASSELQD